MTTKEEEEDIVIENVVGGEGFHRKKKFEETGNNREHIIVIENVEKNLSESTLVEFIHKQTDIILTEAFVLPSFPSDTYTRGIIVVDCNDKLEKLSAFLDNPAHFIVSSRGRPWVIISEKVSMPNMFRVSIEPAMHISQKKALNGDIGNGNCNELRLVLSGNEEYMIAKRMRDLLTTFLDHRKLMHNKLDSEMRKILQQSRAV